MPRQFDSTSWLPSLNKGFTTPSYQSVGLNSISLMILYSFNSAFCTVTPPYFRNTSQSDKRHGLCIGYNNVQGFGIAKQHLMNNILTQHAMDIVGISESKRNGDHPVTKVHPYYSQIGKDRQDGIGGGVGFLYNTKKWCQLMMTMFSDHKWTLMRDYG